MNKANASNTRNVNIRKLRLILERTGDIAINYKGGYWSISIGDDITCDYHEISKILQEVPDKATVDIATLQRILKLAAGGTLTYHQYRMARLFQRRIYQAGHYFHA